MTEGVAIDGREGLRPGPALAAALDDIDLPAVPNGSVVEVLRAAWRQVSHSYAVYLQALVEVGRSVPFDDGPDAGNEAIRAWKDGEWTSAEIAAALTFTARRTDAEYAFAQTVVERLPLVLVALESGRIDHPKARVFAEHLADLSDAQIERICTRLVPRAAGWTTGQLAARLLREIHAIDRDYTRRRYQRAIRGRGVHGYLDADGTATITACGLSPSEAAAAAERLEDLAAAIRRAGHPSTEHQLRADLFLGLLDGRYHGLTRAQIIAAVLADAGLRPPAEPTPDPDAGADPEAAGTAGARDQPPAVPGVEVRIGLGTLLGRDDHPAELPGWGPIDAEDARMLVARQHRAEWRVAVTDHDGYLRWATTTRHRPAPIRTRLSTARPARVRGGVVEIHIPAALLDHRSIAAGEVPPEWAPLVADIAARYAAGQRSDPAQRDRDVHCGDRFARAALRRHVQMRDRTCVAPGCRRPARRADQDHTRAVHDGGATTAENLEPLCRRHHRMKHEGGWRLDQPRPGRFRWRSPLGQIYRTRGDPIAPDLPEPVPRDDDDIGAPDDEPTRVDGPIMVLPPPLPRTPAPAPPRPPVDVEDVPPF